MTPSLCSLKRFATGASRTEPVLGVSRRTPTTAVPTALVSWASPQRALHTAREFSRGAGVGKRADIGVKALPPSSPTLNNSSAEISKSPTQPAPLTSLERETFELGLAATCLLLCAHALPSKVTASCLELLLSTVLDHPNLLSTETLDLSPILWKVKLTSSLGARTQVVDCLCDNRVHC
eukprot:743493-Rhodomonas_salina.2